ncbi:YchJ family protein [Oceanospirillum sediminis]|uniref:YchJ family protein n=1 Tax=Oceanospirillum sediminis TaxID=2760088 RepID=A0A839IRU6_9GAMM|nr:YchJ family protein [Oceanospirillum sediminis]MBB1487651.1 YchJ family protein [Oceanospirillum sediminis]
MSVTPESHSVCPCQSGKVFSECCQPFVQKEQLPETAEALMRSRYTAYVAADLNYLQETTQEAMRSKYDFVALKKWAEESEWLGLTVHSSTEDGDTARVQFTARYRDNDTIIRHSEDSQFIRQDGRWFFVQGKDFTPPAEKAPGRNDPCLCGSGKKYKKCCLNK